MSALDAHHSAFFTPLVFLAASVVVVPVAQKLGLGRVLGYLAAGIIIGPSAAGFVTEPQTVLTVAEFGIVLLLFIIGLELKPSRLWAMRREIFGLGVAQMLVGGATLALVARVAGLPWTVALVVGLGLALSSTAFATPLMSERGELSTPYGQKAFAILLLQDLAIVPLLALVALLSPVTIETPSRGLSVTLGILAATAAVVFAARYLINPLFRMLASLNAREIMTAAALLVVLAAALCMQAAGLSMAMGAFLAGVLLAESTFRHELEADIEPFRGLLLGLFFIAVGMTIDIPLVIRNFWIVGVGVLIFMSLKGLGIFAVARLAGSPREDAARIAGVLAQGGEFAFVLFSAAAASGVMAGETSNLLTAIVALSMALTPLTAWAGRRLGAPPAPDEPDEDFSEARGSVLLIGFGRFGQIVAQYLLASGTEVTTIDNDVEMIDVASRFGFRVYFGDGTRLDVLRAAGAEQVELIAVCIDDRSAALKIVEAARTEFPLAKLFVRSYDRTHTLDLIDRDVDYQIRETFESAAIFGRATLASLGLAEDRADDIGEEVRRRDAERLALQVSEGGIFAGRDLFHVRPAARPEPFTPPRRRQPQESATD